MNRMGRIVAAAVLPLVVGGCLSVAVPPEALRVGTYNIRHNRSGGKLISELDPQDGWEQRKADTVALLRSLDLDVFGLQEAYPEQLAYIRANMPDYEFVGDHRYANRTTGEASPVCYRKSRFVMEKKGTFWLSEKPDVPGTKSWKTLATRICSYLVLKDRVTNRRFSFVNTHLDHGPELARLNGAKLILDRMEEFGAGAPVIFVGDHNCMETSVTERVISARMENAMYLSETPPRGPWRTFNNWRWRAREVSSAEALAKSWTERNDWPGPTVTNVDAFGVAPPRDGSFFETCGGHRIDYIYVTRGMRVLDFETVNASRAGLERYPSDHFPVVSTVLFPSESRCNAALKTLDGPLIQAHRGGRYEYQDNGAGGFRWCLEKGIRGFETDLRFTKDHQLVIMHDRKVDRTTDGTGIVEEMTLDEIKALNLRNSGEKVPSFKDVCDALGGRDDIFVELEMKARPGDFYTPEVMEQYCRAVHDEAARYLKPGTYAFTCFNTNVLWTMRRVDPDAPLALIMESEIKDEHWRQARDLRCATIAPTLKETPESSFRRARDEGYMTCTWMVHDAEEWREARAKGATRITTDYPNLLNMAVRGQKKDIVLIEREALCDKNGAINPKSLEALRTLGERYVVAMVRGGAEPEDVCAVARKLGFDPVQAVVIEAARPRPPRGVDRIIVDDGKKFASRVRVLLKP